MTKASIEQETWECSLGNKCSMLRKKHEILDSNVSVTLTKNHFFLRFAGSNFTSCRFVLR